MAIRTIADRIFTAYNTGKEATFHSDDFTSEGTEYEFTPAGIAQYLLDNTDFLNEIVSAITDTIVDSAVAAVKADEEFVEDGEDGLAKGSIQDALQALATRVQAVEDAHAAEA